MKIYKIIPIISILALFASCGEKDNTENRLNITFAPVDAPKSFMYQNHNCWSPSSEAQLNINGQARQINIPSHINGNDEVWVSLNNITPINNNKYRCFYPHDNTISYSTRAEQTRVTFNIPRDLQYTTIEANGTRVQNIFPPMYGEVTVTSGQTPYISLRNLGGLLEFRIKAAEGLTGSINSITLQSSNIPISGSAYAITESGAYDLTGENSNSRTIVMNVGKSFSSSNIAKEGDYMQIFIPFREYVNADNAAIQQWYESLRGWQQGLVSIWWWLTGGTPDFSALNSRDLTITINATIGDNTHNYVFQTGGSGNSTKPTVLANELVRMSKIQITETQVLNEAGQPMTGWTVQ